MLNLLGPSAASRLLTPTPCVTAVLLSGQLKSCPPWLM